VIIENTQAIEMCNIYRDILSGTMDAFASVISNNVNIVMKLLTVVTLIMNIPVLIASFWGMNTGVPFEGKAWGFWAVIGIAAVVTAIVSYFIIRATSSIKIDSVKKTAHRTRSRKQDQSKE
jgi:magnesium transporter